MNAKTNRRKALWIVLFVVLISLTGLGLAASGNMENPLAAFSNSGHQEGGQRGTPPSGTTANAQPTQGDRGGEGGNSTTINWSAIGGVLYNVWFLFAAAAVFIVVQTVGGGIWQKVRQRVPKTASP